MQILLAWKAQNLSPLEASDRWETLTKSWNNRYQALVDRELHFFEAHCETLYLGLLTVPGMFRKWQEFFDDRSSGVAWAGISHNLFDIFPGKSISEVNARFVEELQKSGDRILSELEGRFVVSVLDYDQQTLRVMTNGYGLSPCFRTKGKYGIALGTRLAPLLDLVGREREPNRIGLTQMFATGGCFNFQTPFEGGFQIEPGQTVMLTEAHPSFQQSCHTSLESIFEKRKTFGNDYLRIGSEAMTSTIANQLRHTKDPLMNLTGGMDSRTIAATVVSLGAQPDCDVSGVEGSRELVLASKVADRLDLALHCFHPGKHYAEQLDTTLKMWSLWTEGMVSAHVAFARSAFALSPRLRRFYRRFTQSFSGWGGEVGRTLYWGPEMLSTIPAPDEIVADLIRKFETPLVSSECYTLMHDEIAANIHEGSELGFFGPDLINYFFWRTQFSRWGGPTLDMQQMGRHVFAPLCQPILTNVFFSLSVEEKLSGAWHIYHIDRVVPALREIPFLTPPLLSSYSSRSFEMLLKKFLLQIHPSVYRAASSIRERLWSKRYAQLPERHRERLGAYFHPYLQRLLFSGAEWWPQIVQYEQGKKIWENFIQEKDANTLWKLVTIELWARTFLAEA